MIKKDVHSEQKEIRHLTQHEVNMIYSLVRIGEWADSEIGRVYRLPEGDVRRVFNNYEELLAEAEKRPFEQVRQDPSLEMIEKPRKRRSDARFTTMAERQAAYRARQKEKRLAAMEQPSQADNTDTPIPTVEERFVTVCEAPVTEIGAEVAETQHSARCGSSEESYDIPESGSLSVTLQTYNETEALRLIEE